ncbi:DUF3558 domain-containing protein [Rhodococcus tibetensis]|uniref:DUF3558 domain-containing protein n=1 Tax=Rhodococcus tibetensis TaxID=2965064 RepID=A0ABT1Q8W9_9NOCA|nr:DUF3558 domain-containing protein [Rhodococcus sp. FXJ9.536]MCQ4117610.1 DUF3558 domain-containing protein [Rhodococcus sp. FXJ9.536]
MRLRSGLIGMVLGAVTAGALVGCSESADGGTAIPVVHEILYHPCDDLSQEAISAAGIDVRAGSRLSDEAANRSCSFRSRDPDFGVVISAIGETFDSVKTSDRFTVLDETTIGGRPALVSDFRGGSACTVSVAIEPGILEFMIGYSELEDFKTVDAACDQATKVATTLAPYFPDHL